MLPILSFFAESQPKRSECRNLVLTENASLSTKKFLSVMFNCGFEKIFYKLMDFKNDLNMQKLVLRFLYNITTIWTNSKMTTLESPATKEQLIREPKPARHSRFGGVVVRQTEKGNVMVKDGYNSLHSSLNDPSRLLRKTKRQLVLHQDFSVGSVNVNELIEQFFDKLLNSMFLPFMERAKMFFDSKSEVFHKIYYIEVLRCLLSFNRTNSKFFQIFSELCTSENLYQVGSMVSESFELVKLEKKLSYKYTPRLLASLGLYHELLLNLIGMKASKSSVLNHCADMALESILNISQSVDVLVDVFRSLRLDVCDYDCLKELIYCVHFYLKVIDIFTKEGGRLRIKTQKKQRKKRAYLKRKRPLTDIKILWKNSKDRILKLILNTDELEVCPFDSSRPVDEQKDEALVKIASLFGQGHHEEAVGLFNAARKVWDLSDLMPNGDITTVESSVRAFKNVVMSFNNATKDAQHFFQEFYDEEEEEERQGEPEPMYVEKCMDINGLVERFSNGNILRLYNSVLLRYETNDAELNHCVAKMLYRMSFDLQKPENFFNIFYFRLFYTIIKDKSNRLSELRNVANKIVQTFFERYEGLQCSFPLLLLWAGDFPMFYKRDQYYHVDEDNEKHEIDKLVQQAKEAKHADQTFSSIYQFIMEGMSGYTEECRCEIESKILSGFEISDEVLRSKEEFEWNDETKTSLQRLYDDYKSTKDPYVLIKFHEPFKALKCTEIKSYIEELNRSARGTSPETVVNQHDGGDGIVIQRKNKPKPYKDQGFSVRVSDRRKSRKVKRMQLLDD